MNNWKSFRFALGALALGLLVVLLFSCGQPYNASGQGEPTGQTMQATAEAGLKDGGLKVTVIDRPGVRCIVVRGSSSTEPMRMSCAWDDR